MLRAFVNRTTLVPFAKRFAGTQPKDHHYTAVVEWTGASKGPAVDYKTYSRQYQISLAGKKPIDCSADPSFLGDASLFNPEDGLFTAISGCHMLSYLAVAVRAGIQVISYVDRPTGKLSFVKDGYQFTEVVLNPTIKLGKGADIKKAEALHETAHHNCFIARSVNFPIVTKPIFETA